MTDPRPTGGRPPQARTVENDRRLLDAAVDVLARSGWSGLSFLQVSAHAGLSRRSLQNRYSSTSALAVAVWRLRCSDALERALDDVIASIDRSEDDLVRTLTVMNQPGPDLCAALELVVVSQFDGSLRDAVTSTLGMHVKQLCAPDEAASSPATAARRAYVLSLALGLSLASRANGGSDIELRPGLASLFSALQTEHAPMRLPRQPAKHLVDDLAFDTGDPILDELLVAVLEHVGASGFDGSSVDRIASSAGVTTGALFARFRSKLELFLDATRRQLERAMPATQSYMADLDARHGDGVGAASNIAESQRPGRAHLRAIALEQIRVSLHYPDLRAARQAEVERFAKDDLGLDPSSDEGRVRAEIHLAVALGIGIAVLPLLDPSCWSLPYDVVTVPLLRLRSRGTAPSDQVGTGGG